MFFFSSAVGKKAVMALSGIVLFVYVLLHMLGNLKYFQGAEHLNEYAHWLRVMGTPVIPYSGVLWLVRVILAVSLLLHVTASVQVTYRNWRARPTPYHRWASQESTFASRTMRWTGWAVLAFIIYHILDMTFGVGRADFRPDDVFHNIVAGFKVWWIALIYILAQLALGLHLCHGLWSLFQSLGWNHPRYNHWRNYFAWTAAFLIAGANILIVVFVLFRG
jgi:succinate dehydrogenase / fumarate reductase cytochrome b subunit